MYNIYKELYNTTIIYNYIIIYYIQLYNTYIIQ